MNFMASGNRSVIWPFACALFLLGAAPLLATSGFADTLPVTTLPGDPVTPGTRLWQRKADEAFEQEDYERAHRIFLKKLAPKGDKHAHYMLGLLNERGLGVPEDRARALAWYVLAAERGSGEVKAVAERLLAELGPSEEKRADAILAELLERYGDRPLLIKAIRRDLREVRRRTGSYLGGGTSPTLVITPDGSAVDGDQFFKSLEDRIAFRLRLLGGNVSLGELLLIESREDEARESEEP